MLTGLVDPGCQVVWGLSPSLVPVRLLSKFGAPCYSWHNLPRGAGFGVIYRCVSCLEDGIQPRPDISKQSQ